MGPEYDIGAAPDLRLIEPHLSGRLLRGLLLFLDRRWGAAAVDRLLAEAGASRGIAEGANSWFSVVFQRRLNGLIEAEAARRPGWDGAASREALWRDAGRFGWDREAMGPLLGVIRSLGSPRGLLRSLPDLVPRGNRTVVLSVCDDAPGCMTLRLVAAEGFAPLAWDVAVSFDGMLEAAPTIWGLPMARTSRRDVPCPGGLREAVYTVRYVDGASSVPVRGVGAALAAGLAAGLAVSAAVGLAVGVGLLAGAVLWRARRQEAALLHELQETSAVFAALDERIVWMWREQEALRRALLASRKLSGYLAVDLVERIVADPDVELALGGERAEAAVLFVDIVGFTPRCEARSPEAIIEELNTYFRHVDPAFRDNGGVIDKRMGDGIMGVFLQREAEPPEAAQLRALRGALAILAAVPACNQVLAAQGSPPLQVRVGVAWGPLVQGNIGSPFKLEYTVIGDTVNLAARLEGAAAPGAVLVNEDGLPADLSALGPHTLGRRETIRVKGKRDAVPVVTLMPG